MRNQQLTWAGRASRPGWVWGRSCWGLAIALVALGGANTVLAQAPDAIRGQAVDSTSQPISWAWGSDRAIIEIVEFTDFACTFCAQFHQESYEALFAEYVATGKVRWVLVPFASGRFRGSEDALAFAVCGVEQGRDAASLRRHLFERRDSWIGSGAAEELSGYAAELGLEMRRYEECAESEDTAARIRENGRRAREAGVRGTPQLFVEGFPVIGALPTAFYRRVFDQAIERVQRGRRVSTNSTPFAEFRP